MTTLDQAAKQVKRLAEQSVPAEKDGFYLETIPGMEGLWVVSYANGQPFKAWPDYLWFAWGDSPTEVKTNL